ncbi:MAG: hypothetical protein WCR52_10225 [Bacteroidota bacterium]
MQKRYPFKFLDAYTRADSDFYFGRSDEINALYEMVFQTDLLLVYGASGTGKSSLIQCGLASKFQSHDWLALNIRRGGDLNESFEKALDDAGGRSEGVTSSHPLTDFDWLDDERSNDQPQAASKILSPLARRFKAIYLKHFKPVYLIFDQFEELYILGNQREQRQFVETVQEILRVEQPVKIILSIREEYLGHLYEFERAMPELLRKKLRVEPMNLDKVKTVIQSVGAQPMGNVRLQTGEEADIAEAIFEKIRGDEKTLHIPLPYLQVFLDKLYLQITGDKTRQAEAVFSMQELSKIGDLGDVLRNFLDEQVRDIAPELGKPQEMLWQSLSPFVTLDGTKEPLSEAQLADKLPDADADFVRRALQAFVKGRILRFSEATQRYEIAHDALAKQIHAKRSDEEIAILEVQRLVKSQTAMADEAREFFTEKQLLFIEPYLAKFRPSAEESDWIARSRAEVLAQKEAAALRQAEELENARTRAVEAERLTNAAEQGRKRARTFSYLAGLVAVVAIGAGVYAFFQKKEADANLRRMEVANAARLKTEIGKYITAAERMRKSGDEDMAKAILEEANKLDSLEQNPAVDSLLMLLK